MEFSNYCFDTLCVQGSPEAKSVDLSGAISVPLVQSATFAHPGLGESTGYDYSRLSNPTRKFLEEMVAALDGAKFGFAFSCGMAAETAFFSMLETLLPLSYCCRTLSFLSMVCKNEAACRKSAEGMERRRSCFLSKKMGKHIHSLARKYTRLVCEPSNLVGTQNSCMVL